MVSLLVVYLVMQMVSGGLSGSAHLSDDLTGDNRIPCLYTEFLQTAIKRSTSIFMGQLYAVAQNVIKSAIADSTVESSQNQSALLCRDVYAGVTVLFPGDGMVTVTVPAPYLRFI